MSYGVKSKAGAMAIEITSACLAHQQGSQLVMTWPIRLNNEECTNDHMNAGL